MHDWFSCVWLFATLWTAVHQVHRILQARILPCPLPDNHKGTEYLESWRLYLSLSQCLQNGRTFNWSNDASWDKNKIKPCGLGDSCSHTWKGRMHVQGSYRCHNAQKHGTPSASWIENKESGTGWVPCKRGEQFTTFFLSVSFHVLLI